MVFQEVVDRFEKQSPVPVMVGATLANVLSAEHLDQIFEEHAVRQRVDELAFSTVADLMGMVVSRTEKSINSAYQTHQDNIHVAIKSVYNKLQGIETQTSEAVVRCTAERFRQVIAAMSAELPSSIPGYRIKILDGNHLAATQRRIKELRTQRGGPLPGTSLAVLDPQLKLITDVFLSEDGHEQERSILLKVIDRLQPGEVWMTDRNFCTSLFLFEVDLNKSFFIVRQHKTNAPWRERGDRQAAGNTDTGEVFEQAGVVLDVEKNELPARRITLKLKKATQDGDRELHILTSLPDTVPATVIADAYRQRWTIEKAFCELTLSLKCEVNTLGYPKAALFGFSMAVVMHNVLSVARAAIRAAHGKPAEQQVSTYYLADELSGIWRGMLIILPEEYWKQSYGPMSAQELAAILLRLAQQVNLRRFRKSVRGPKKPPPKRNRGKPGHIATSKVLAKRKN